MPLGYESVTLVEGLLVTSPLAVWHGLDLYPVPDDRHRLGIAVVLDDILASSGWHARVNSLGWAASERQNLPLTLIRHLLPAASADEALRHSAVFVDVVLDVLALHRAAAGIPLVTVVEQREGEPTEPSFAVSSRSRVYRGNLLGGFISGEEPQSIGRSIEAAAKHPLAMVWLGARRDIAAERNPMFAVHRWWNLVEAISASRERPVEEVADFEGAPILRPDTGRPVKSSGQPGGVYVHVKEALQLHKFEPTAFAMKPALGDLWQTLVAWYGLRNAIAHHGRFDPSSDRQKQWWWFPAAEAAWSWEGERQGSIQRLVSELGDFVLHWELDHLIRDG